MPAWRCPQCDRQFARVNQGHMCAPGLTIEEYFSTGPAFERPIFEAVRVHLDSVGDVHVEPVSVGIFLKRARSFAQLRPMTKWVALSFGLRRQVRHRTITRKVVDYHGLYHHVANLVTPDDVDDDIRGWLTEAYLDSPPA